MLYIGRDNPSMICFRGVPSLGRMAVKGPLGFHCLQHDPSKRDNGLLIITLTTNLKIRFCIVALGGVHVPHSPPC